MDDHFTIKKIFILILNKLGYQVSRSQWASFPDSVNENTVFTMTEQWADRQSIPVRTIELHDRWWQEDNGFLLGFYNNAACLLEFVDECYHLVTSSQKRIPVTASIAKNVTPTAQQFTPHVESKSTTLSRLFLPHVRNIRTDIMLVFLISLSIAVISLILPITTGILFDKVIPFRDTVLKHQIFFFLSAMLLATGLFQIARRFLLLRVVLYLSNKGQSTVISRLLSLPLSFFQRYSPYDLTLRSHFVDGLRDTLDVALLAAWISSLFTLVNLILLFYYSVWLALIATGVSLVTIMIYIIFAIKVYPYLESAYRNTLESSSKCFQILQAANQLRLSNAQSRALSQWEKYFARKKFAELKGAQLGNLANLSQKAITSLSVIIFMYIALNFVSAVGDFIAFLVAYTMVVNAINSLGQQMVMLVSLAPMVKLVKPILESAPEDNQNGVIPTQLNGNISVRDLCYASPGSQLPILNHVSLDIRAGESVAIVGPSGSGKTTLLKCLIGMQSPSEGAVLIDDIDLSTYSAKHYRKRLGIVLQSSELLSDSIYHNLIMNKPLSMEAAWAQCERLGIKTWLESLPMQLHTPIVNSQSTFSGGEKQLLLIARELIKTPDIIFLDEATSAMDNRSQRKIMRILNQEKITRVMVAHRLSSIESVDKIIVMSEGKIVQCGSFKSLLQQQDGLFYQLMHSQIIAGPS